MKVIYMAKNGWIGHTDTEIPNAEREVIINRNGQEYCYKYDVIFDEGKYIVLKNSNYTIKGER